MTDTTVTANQGIGATHAPSVTAAASVTAMTASCVPRLRYGRSPPKRQVNAPRVAIRPAPRSAVAQPIRMGTAALTAARTPIGQRGGDGRIRNRAPNPGPAADEASAGTGSP